VKHPDQARLLSWLEAPDDIDPNVAEHLSSGCEECAEKLAALVDAGTTLAAAAALESPPVPDDAERCSTDKAVRELSRRLGRWKVDDTRGEKAVGQRGAHGETLRIFRGAGFDATLRIRCDDGFGGSIRGRLLLVSVPEQIEVYLTSGGEPQAQGQIDSRGRFRFESVPPGHYEMRFFLPDHREVALHGIDVPGASAEMGTTATAP